MQEGDEWSDIYRAPLLARPRFGIKQPELSLVCVTSHNKTGNLKTQLEALFTVVPFRRTALFFWNNNEKEVNVMKVHHTWKRGGTRGIDACVYQHNMR